MRLKSAQVGQFHLTSAPEYGPLIVLALHTLVTVIAQNDLQDV